MILASLSLTFLHPAYSHETVIMEDCTPLFTPSRTAQELSVREQALARQINRQERLWQEGFISRYEYFTTMGNWLMTRFELSRQKTPRQKLSEEQKEFATEIIDNFKTRIDTLERLASAGQAEEENVIKLKLNLLLFRRDLSIAAGESKETVMQHQKHIVEQSAAWPAFVQKAVDNHVMGLADLQRPGQCLRKNKNGLTARYIHRQNQYRHGTLYTCTEAGSYHHPSISVDHYSQITINIKSGCYSS